MNAKRSRLGLLVVLLLAAAAQGAADDLFYVEAERDGRLYVFADRNAHERWSRGSDPEHPITLKDYGPRGEDVVFDEEAAVNLYNARHAKAGPKEASPEAKGAKTRVYWDFETVMESDRVRIAVQNRVQFRFRDELPNDALQLPGAAKPGDSRASFQIRRAKTRVDGFLLWKELTYELQIGWAGADSGIATGTTFSGLEDAYLNWDVSKKQAFEVRGGQFKVPFGRQELTSSERLQFVDRSIVTDEFVRGRDVGVQVAGLLVAKKLSYALGLFNGNGRNRPTNDNSKFLYAARVTFQPWGGVGYSEGDFESKDHPLFEVAGELQRNNQQLVTNANDFDDTTFGADAVFKWKGISLYAEYFDRKRTPEEGASFHSTGFVGQAGCFLQRDRWEVAFRYAVFDPIDFSPGNDRTEVGGALSYYIRGHRLKLQSDFRHVEDKGRGEASDELRIQTQFVF